MTKKKVQDLTDGGDFQEGDYIVGERTAGTTVKFSVPALGGAPGGSDTQLQYNNSGSFGGISSLTYNGSNITSTAGVTIDGTSDEIQLKVQGHSTQTSNIFEIENSAGTNLVTVDNSGNVTVSGTVDGRDVATDGTKLDGIESNATADQSTEEIQDAAWSAVATGTQTLITVTYQDATNDVDFVVDNDLSNYSNTNSAFITASSTDTLTNKTFNANGTGNSLSNVDVADLANGTDGELITWDAAGAPATVSVGTSGQVLTSNGVGAAPTFQNAASGGALIGVNVKRSTTQSITNSVLTKVQLDSEDFDTEGDFDNSTNYRWTPSTAGKYFVYAVVKFNSISDRVNGLCYIYLNGSIYTQVGSKQSTASTGELYSQVSTIIDVNGSTDYIEMYVFHNDSSSKNIADTTRMLGYYLGT